MVSTKDFSRRRKLGVNKERKNHSSTKRLHLINIPHHYDMLLKDTFKRLKISQFSFNGHTLFPEMFGLTHETKMVLKALEQTLSEHGEVVLCTQIDAVMGVSGNGWHRRRRTINVL